jgi:hypothetical protein
MEKNKTKHKASEDGPKEQRALVSSRTQPQSKVRRTQPQTRVLDARQRSTSSRQHTQHTTHNTHNDNTWEGSKGTFNTHHPQCPSRNAAPAADNTPHTTQHNDNTWEGSKGAFNTRHPQCPSRNAAPAAGNTHTTQHSTTTTPERGPKGRSKHVILNAHHATQHQQPHVAPEAGAQQAEIHLPSFA